MKNHFKIKYKQDDIAETLEEMYLGKCCYCEVGMGTTDYEHIEHLKPKSLTAFHYLCFEWTNLHWACSRCNVKKGKNWSDSNPILDPTVDSPEEHITFDLHTCKAIALGDSSRGQYTIETVGLNRKKLLLARSKLRDRTINFTLQMLSTESKKDEEFYRDFILEGLADDADHSLFIKTIVKQYL